MRCVSVNTWVDTTLDVDINPADVLNQLTEKELNELIAGRGQSSKDLQLANALTNSIDQPLAGGWLERAARASAKHVMVEQRLLERLHEALAEWVAWNQEAGR